MMPSHGSAPAGYGSIVARELWGLVLIALILTSPVLVFVTGVKFFQWRFERKVCASYPDFQADSALFERFSYPADFLDAKVAQMDTTDGGDIDRLVVGATRYGETWSSDGTLLGAGYDFLLGPNVPRGALLGQQDWRFSWDEASQRFVGRSDRIGNDVWVDCR
jgi:hypothetical protein